jgi:hypothetical protein
MLSCWRSLRMWGSAHKSIKKHRGQGFQGFKGASEMMRTQAFVLPLESLFPGILES